jgi:cobalt/nickel transport system permease protein
LEWPTAIAELQRVGLPRAAVAFLSLLARHVEVLAEDARSVVSVLKARGAFDRKTNMPRAVTVLLSRLLALAWQRADRVADAMALRGFDGRLPPNAEWRPRLREARLYAVTLVVLGAAVWEVAR